MNSAISKKMDMVKDVFLKQKRLEEDIAFADFVFSNPDYYEEDFSHPMLLVEGKSRKSKKKESNKRIARIKNNKGEYVDIKKVKQDDTSLLELPPPEDDSQLITIGNQNTIPETKNLLDKIKKGKKGFKEFIKQREKSFGGDYELKNEIEYMKPKLVRKEVEEILF